MSADPPSSPGLRASDADRDRVTALIVRLLRRGIDDGTFRGDLTVEDLGLVLGGLLQAAARMAAGHQAGVEQAAALVTSVFLHGTANRNDAT
jgi:TetR/AcrR family transcriptional regulator, mexCD-oprJ operon repressor